MRRLAALTLGMLALAGSGAAQEADAARQTIVAPAALRGDFFHIESAEVGRGFDIYVRYPDGYAASDATYPVVYLTDCDPSTLARGTFIDVEIVGSQEYDLVARPI